jgi:hypothetical protein
MCLHTSTFWLPQRVNPRVSTSLTWHLTSPTSVLAALLPCDIKYDHKMQKIPSYTQKLT